MRKWYETEDAQIHYTCSYPEETITSPVSILLCEGYARKIRPRKGKVGVLLDLTISGGVIEYFTRMVVGVVELLIRVTRATQDSCTKN
jgi:hypothetical protein